MPDGLDFTPDEIEIEVERLAHFLDAVLEPEELYEIRPVPFTGKGSGWARPGDIPAAVPTLMEWNRAGSNPYFSVNPRVKVGGTKGVDSRPGSLVVADFDSGIPLDEVKAKIGAAGLPAPTAIVCTSPQHWHTYWRLDARLPDLATFKAIQKGLSRTLGSCPNVSSFQQVMRLPGPFANVKPDRPNHPRVRLVECDPNRIYPGSLFPAADPEPTCQAVPLEELAIVIEKGSMSDKTKALVEHGIVPGDKGRRASIFEAARDMKARTWERADAEKVLVAVGARLGLEPDDLADVPRQVRNAFETPATPGYAAAEVATIDFEASAPIAPAPDEEPYDAELEAIPLPEPPALPPRPAIALDHGIVGDFMRRVEFETEAHPVALATTLLVALGSVIGRGPTFWVGRTPHHVNLFAAIVGNTGAGRKGTGLDIVRDCIRSADEHWAEHCQSPNLTSGEGVVDALRDPVVKLVPVKGKPEEVERVVVDPGVEDKRLFIVSPELVAAFKCGNRENSTLAQTLREAWDGRSLRTMAKTAGRVATDPHLAIIGHATRNELVRVMRETDVHGGSANRFLWVLSDRARLLPHGGDLDDLGTIPQRVADVVDFARGVGRMRRTPEADRLWEQIYGELVTPRGSEIVAAVLSRGEAQTLRLSMLFGLVAQRAEITADDLAAAVDLWRYCRASAESIFGGVHDPLFHKVLEAIIAAPGITRSRLHKRIGWRLPSTELVAVLGRIRASGQARMEVEPTPGKPAERWWPAANAPGGGGERGARGDKGSDPDPYHPNRPQRPAAPAEPVAWDPDNLAAGVYTL